MRFLALLYLALLAGCDSGIGPVLDQMNGRDKQVLILQDEPTTIEPNGVSLNSKEPMKVLGNSSSVCFVLKGNVPLGPGVEETFNKIIKGIDGKAILQSASGEKVVFKSMGYAWRKNGLFTKENELSGCLSCGCGPNPEVGTEFSKITINTSKPLQVNGIYWESSSALD